MLGCKLRCQIISMTYNYLFTRSINVRLPTSLPIYSYDQDFHLPINFNDQYLSLVNKRMLGCKLRRQIISMTYNYLVTRSMNVRLPTSLPTYSCDQDFHLLHVIT